MPERVVIVEDDPELRRLLEEVLSDAGYSTSGFASAEAALGAIGSGLESDLVITDLILPDRTGQDLLKVLRRDRPETHVIVMTAFGSLESAVELVKAGAFDYLTKPLGTDELLLSVERALADSVRSRRHAREDREGRTLAPAGFVGSTPAMQDLYALIGRAAASPHAVLVTGESGTGKELVARALHRGSGRNAFVTVNCGALPEHLLESELFGHERGAFTGADRAKDGLFQVAHEGTLFLDEIAELPLALQPKLLRALEQSEIRRVGSTRATEVDVRILAATNRDLDAELAAGRFRADLYWRLNVLTIHVPPLRERRPDIAPLARHFLARAADEGKLGTWSESGRPEGHAPLVITEEAMALLEQYHWPGNVRELRNAILRGATLATGPAITEGVLPPRVQSAGEVEGFVGSALRRQLSLADVERLYILQVLKASGGNKSRAADTLGLDRKTLYRKLDEYRGDDPTL